MIRLTHKGGVRLRSFAIGLLMLAPLAASAAGWRLHRSHHREISQPPSARPPTAADTQMRATELPAARFGVALKRVRTTALGSQVLKVDRKLSLEEARRLAADIAASDPNVEYAEPDRMMRALLTPNDPRYNEQWHYFESTAGINAPPAWDKATGTGVVVGIVDTGYRPHADLSGQILPGLRLHLGHLRVE